MIYRVLLDISYIHVHFDFDNSNDAVDFAKNIVERCEIDKDDKDFEVSIIIVKKEDK